jgi:lysyl endopeptidase
MSRGVLRLVVCAGLCAPLGVAQAQQVYSNTDPIVTVSPTAPARLDARPAGADFAPLDIDGLRAIEQIRENQGLIRHFAVPSMVDYRPDTSGEVTVHDDGMVSWRFTITSKNAKNINIGTEWDVPDSTFMLLLDGNGDSPYDPFTAEFNNVNNELWTPVVEGDTMEIYVEVLAEDWQAFVDGFRIKQISLGFLAFGEAFVEGDIDLRSNSCHYDVECPEADPWPSQVSSVGAYTINGFGTCSGALINNTDEDGTPYFMTANHCGAHTGAPSMVVYWNYQNSFCRPPGSAQSGQSGNGPLNQFTSGSVNRMTYQPADFTLNELNSVPNPAWNVDYCGWDRRGLSARPTSGFGIHHPGVEEKRISIENNTFGNGTISIGGPGISAWTINFDLGGLEGGSSGSPLYDQVGRAVGTATAVNTFNPVCGAGQSQSYGRLDRAWTGGGSSSSRLSDWLDPGNTGSVTLNALNWDPPFIEDFSINSPSDGEQKVLVNPTLDWSAAVNADVYNVLIDDNADFFTPVVDVQVSAPTTSYQPGPGVLAEDTTYYLRVEAENLLETVPALNSDLVFTTMIDCDGNLVHDPDELAGNDCNENGVLDACDIVGGPFYASSGQPTARTGTRQRDPGRVRARRCARPT